MNILMIYSVEPINQMTVHIALHEEHGRIVSGELNYFKWNRHVQVESVLVLIDLYYSSISLFSAVPSDQRSEEEAVIVQWKMTGAIVSGSPSPKS